MQFSFQRLSSSFIKSCKLGLIHSTLSVPNFDVISKFQRHFVEVVKRRFSKLRNKIISLITQFVNHTLRLIPQLLMFFVNGFIEKIRNKLDECRPPDFIKLPPHPFIKYTDTKHLTIRPTEALLQNCADIGFMGLPFRYIPRKNRLRDTSRCIGYPLQTL
ncbi:hypothetical protein WJ64_19525 [Burkholderia ubonensis]|nr:hypothetical protein WJ64_19525 [Burkholderia ubonensis]